MRVNRYNFLFVIGLVLTLGLSAALANGDNHRKKPPKGMGTLNVKTTIVNPTPSFWVKVEVDGVERTVKGTETEIDLKEGDYTVYVTTSDGGKWNKPISIRRGKKACICLTITTKMKQPCRYRFRIDGPTKFKEGDPVTFTAVNEGTEPLPSDIRWQVSPADLTFKGQGTRSITIDTAGIGTRKITAKLDFNEDRYEYDAGCTNEATSVPDEKPEFCPYRLKVNRSAYSISDGEEVTFTYENDENSPTPSQYKWNVTPYGASIISGQGTPSITVRATGIAGQNIVAELDTNDDRYAYYDRCKAENSVPVPEELIEVLSWDLLKGILDNQIIGFNAKPNHTLYVRIYPGTDNASRTRFTYRRVMNEINKYLTGPKNVDPELIKFEQGETRSGRTYVRIQVVPPGQSPRPWEPPPPPGRRY